MKNFTSNAKKVIVTGTGIFYLMFLFTFLVSGIDAGGAGLNWFLAIPITGLCGFVYFKLDFRFHRRVAMIAGIAALVLINYAKVSVVDPEKATEYLATYVGVAAAVVAVILWLKHSENKQKKIRDAEASGLELCPHCHNTHPHIGFIQPEIGKIGTYEAGGHGLFSHTADHYMGEDSNGRAWYTYNTPGHKHCYDCGYEWDFK